MNRFLMQIVLAIVAVISAENPAAEQTTEAPQLPSIWAPAPRLDSLPGSGRRARPLLAHTKGSFATAYDDSRDELFVRNGKVGLGVGGWKKGPVRITSMHDFASGVEWIGTIDDDAKLWDVEIVKSDGETFHTDSGRLGAAQSALQTKGDRLTMTMSWDTAKLAQTAGGIAVRATLTLRVDSPLIDWQIEVDNRLEKAGLWRIAFPILAGVGYEKHTDFVDHGYVYRRCDELREGQLWSIQLVAASCGDSTLYVGAHDPQHHQKHYRFQAGKELAISVFPPDAGASGKSYRQSYPIKIGPIKGNWFDAAQVYREWATQQSWCQRGPVAQWTDDSNRVPGVVLWLTSMWPLGGKPLELAERVTQIRDHFQVPTGVHWYHWWSKRGSFQPHSLFREPRENFVEAATLLRERGIVPMPYINVLYWEMGQRDRGQYWPKVRALWPEFEEQARAHACRAPELLPVPGRRIQDYYLTYVGKSIMVAMCRATSFWQTHNVKTVRRLQGWGIDVVYLDQAASTPRWPCFDPDHGHALGGGSHWAQGTREMYRRMKHETGKPLAFSGEGRFEGYLGLIEMDLTGYWNKPHQRSLLFEAVYGDYGLSIARLVERSPDAFATDFGMCFLGGAQARVGSQWVLNPGFTEQAQFLRKLLRLKVEARSFLTYGRLLKAPPWTDGPATMLVKWRNPKRRTEGKVRVPVLERAAYRSPDGRAGVCIVNVSPDEQNAALDLGALVSKRKASVCVKTWNGKERELAEISPDAAAVSLRVPAREAMLLVLTQ